MVIKDNHREKDQIVAWQSRKFFIHLGNLLILYLKLIKLKTICSATNPLIFVLTRANATILPKHAN